MTGKRFPIDLKTLKKIAANGWLLVPLVPGEKRPFLKKWQEAATSDSEQIEAWWTEGADRGHEPDWGVVNADVADIDRPDQMELELPEDAPRQDTPKGGTHVLMRASGRRLPGKLPGGAGEWRADGKALVKIYEPTIFLANPPDTLPEVPEAAFARPVGSGGTSDEPLELTTREELMSLVGTLRSDGLDPDHIFAALQAMREGGNLYDSDPDDPWTDRHLRQIANEAGKWKRGEVIPQPRIVRAGHKEADDGDGPEIVPLSTVPLGEERPLLLDRLHPDEMTIMFGDGGTGKGVLAAWWAVRLVRELNLRVLIIDYEQHARYEWRPRVQSFGGTDLERCLRDIEIVQPHQPIWKVAPYLAEQVKAKRIDYVILDSIAYAVSDMEAEKSTTATRVTAAYQEIGLPMLALAHTTKADADPRHPFGSVFWSNSARVTMSFVGQGLEPRILTMKKTNQKARFQPSEFEWDWAADELPETLLEKPHNPSRTDALLEIFKEHGNVPMTVAALMEASSEGQTPEAKAHSKLKRSIETALSGGRSPSSSAFHRVDGTRPQEWVPKSVTVRRAKGVPE